MTQKIWIAFLVAGWAGCVFLLYHAFQVPPAADPYDCFGAARYEAQRAGCACPGH